MGKSWEAIVINWDGDEIPLPKVVALWSPQDNKVTYRNLKSVEDHLIAHQFNIPPEIVEHLENSLHKQLGKGKKKEAWKKHIRDLGIYLDKSSPPVDHGQPHQVIEYKLEELGPQDENI